MRMRSFMQLEACFKDACGMCPLVMIAYSSADAIAYFSGGAGVWRYPIPFFCALRDLRWKNCLRHIAETNNKIHVLSTLTFLLNDMIVTLIDQIVVAYYS